MNIHFNDTRPAGAPAATLFEVITDYPSYPDFNSALIYVRVVKKDDTGAEFVADRKVKIGQLVRAHDRYGRDQDFVVERTGDRRRPAPPGSSIPWTPAIQRLRSTPLSRWGRCEVW